MWDLTTALEMMNKAASCSGGPTPNELLQLLDQCDLTSKTNTPSISPAPSVLQVPLGPTVCFPRPSSVAMDSEAEEEEEGKFYPDTLVTKI